jgi:hypothetical protein
MSLSRRSFFTKLAGVAVAVKVAPFLSQATWPDSDRTLVAIPSDVAPMLTREQVARWFDVPVELIGDTPTFEPLFGDARFARLPESIYRKREALMWGEDFDA